MKNTVGSVYKQPVRATPLISPFETLPTVEKETEESYSDTEVSLAVEGVDEVTSYAFKAQRPTFRQWLSGSTPAVEVTVTKRERVLDEDSFSFLPTIPREIETADPEWKPGRSYVPVAGGSPRTTDYEPILAAKIPEPEMQRVGGYLSPNDQGNLMGRMLKERTPPASVELIQRLKKLPKRQKIEFTLPQGKSITHEQKSAIKRIISDIVSGKLIPKTK